MDTINRDFLINHGFKEDTDRKVLSELFTGRKKFKEVNISVHFTEPSMLLARSKENNVIVKVNCIQENRLILKRKRSREKFDTTIMNVLLDEINGCLVKDYGNGLIQFEFGVRDFRCSLNIAV